MQAVSQRSPLPELDSLAPVCPPDQAVLALRAVRKSYGARTILAGVDLTVAPESLVLVTGANGAGKTTLLRLAAGLLLPDQGLVSLGGLDAERDRRAYRRRMGFLSAGDRGLYPRLSVRQNLDFAARLALLERSELQSSVSGAIGRFGLAELASQRVNRLSMGQRQRVRIAMTVLHDPALLLLDEPATSLDDEGLCVLRDVLADVVARGGAAVWCAPDGLEHTLPVDHRYVVRDGELEAA
jgi:ABC-type multidrug transport system ATPase subunit